MAALRCWRGITVVGKSLFSATNSSAVLGRKCCNAMLGSSKLTVKMLQPYVNSCRRMLHLDSTVGPRFGFSRKLLGAQPPIETTTRSKVNCSVNKGKPKTVKAVIRRFYRLEWGGWIRTRAGRKKNLWKKDSERKKRLRQHVFCNSTQSKLLDKMVTKYWMKKRHYPDSPYVYYHRRTGLNVYSEKPIFLP